MENITVEEWRRGGGEERLNTSWRENAGQRSAAGAELVHWIPLGANATQCSAKTGGEKRRETVGEKERKCEKRETRNLERN